MKRPQTKFHADTMSHSKVIGSKKVRIYHYVKIYWQVEIFLQQSFLVIHILLKSQPEADPDQAFRGAVKLGGAKNVFTCLNTKGCLRQSLCVTQKRLSFIGQKVAIFVGRTMLLYFSGNNHSLKALYIINSENVWNGPQTVGLVFHKLHRSRIFTKCIWKV